MKSIFLVFFLGAFPFDGLSSEWEIPWLDGDWNSSASATDCPVGPSGKRSVSFCPSVPQSHEIPRCAVTFLKCANRSAWHLRGWIQEGGVCTDKFFFLLKGRWFNWEQYTSSGLCFSAHFLLQRGLTRWVVRLEQSICEYCCCGCGTQYLSWRGSVWGAAKTKVVSQHACVEIPLKMSRVRGGWAASEKGGCVLRGVGSYGAEQLSHTVLPAWLMQVKGVKCHFCFWERSLVTML